MNALKEAEISFLDGKTAAALGEHVTLLPPAATKGLEFDAVVVVEPAEIISEARRGSPSALCGVDPGRAALSVVHSRPLPLALAA